MHTRRFVILTALLLVFARQLHAQVKVDVGLTRRLYLLYEPIPITVAITNLSGHDLTLSDSDQQKWFSFQVTYVSGDEPRIVPPMDVNYKLAPLQIPAGETVKQTVNLTTMYAVQDIGEYHFRASIYVAESNKYTSSMPEELQISDGRLVWEQTVGVPEGVNIKGTHRTWSLLKFRQPKFEVLYVRVEDKDSGIIYTTSPVGPLIGGVEPTYMLDKDNLLHVMELIGPKMFVYTRIGLNGEIYNQVTYSAANSRPVLKKDAEGEVYVEGGQVFPAGGPETAAAPGPASPGDAKLSERPANFAPSQQ